jgi:hypothetical protein
MQSNQARLPPHAIAMRKEIQPYYLVR